MGRGSTGRGANGVPSQEEVPVWLPSPGISPTLLSPRTSPRQPSRPPPPAARENTCCELHLVYKFQKFPWPLLTHPDPRTKEESVFLSLLSVFPPSFKHSHHLPSRAGVLDLWSQEQYQNIYIFYNTTSSHISHLSISKGTVHHDRMCHKAREGSDLLKMYSSVGNTERFIPVALGVSHSC